MAQDTVLIGGLAVLLFFYCVWRIHEWAANAGLSPETRRRIGILLVLVVLGAAVAAIHWHSTRWLAARGIEYQGILAPADTAPKAGDNSTAD